MCLSLKEETTNIKALTGNVIIHNVASKPKTIYLTYLVYHSASAFGFHRKGRPTT